MLKLKRPVGLFLCGGGALGSWQSGALSRLAEAGLEADAVAGFSVGVLNGAAYCFGRTDELEDIWAGMRPEMILKPRPSYRRMPLDLHSGMSAGGPLARAGQRMQDQLAKFSLFSAEPLYALVGSWLGGRDLPFARKTVFYVISHCVERRLPQIFRFDGKAGGSKIAFNDALISSCAIPSVFPPVTWFDEGKKRHLVDGGVIGLATINLNVLEGCRTVIMLSNSREEEINFKGTGWMSFFENKARRMLAVHSQKIYESRVLIRSSPEVHLLKPQEDLGMGILELQGAKCRRAFEVGEKAAMDFIAGLESRG
ncbi:MAG: NTE family protein [Elusimicrobia bacterium]|nr:MAG: NTE family protein [Elusimicrobiota bacterium]KAF0157316.1 MAG: NTE family protein [Elusimicrobiota bacterium]